MKFKLIALLLLVIACAAFTPLKAQTEIEINPNGRSYSQIFDSISTGLIYNRIPYGVLYDRVYQWSGLSGWQSGDTTSISHLYQSLYDAEQSVMDSIVRPNRYEAMRNTVLQQLYQVRLPVIAICYRFGYFDSMAVSDGRLTVTNNGMLIDNNNASPYLTKQICVAGAGLDELIANKNYILQFDTSLLLNNTPQTIQSIVVNNITTSVQYTLTVNGVQQQIQFTQTGKNILRFTILLNNGTSYITHQTVQVEDINSGAGSRVMGLFCDPTNDLVESAIPFAGYDETIATNSFADYHIYYHNQSPSSADCERVLRKPIIILDGFDPQNTRNYKKIYGEQLAYQNNTIYLGDELRAKGYDIIILNFPKLGSIVDGVTGVASLNIPADVKVNATIQTVNKFDRDGGTDYIERNAFLLVKLIQQVNATLAANGSAEKLVIIGPSMGGQISRYALAYMEKQQSLGVANMNHNTRLFLSFDSPNDGANIPLALHQNLLFYGYTGGSQDAKTKYLQQLHSVAARQMLIEQYGSLNSSAYFHQTYYNNAHNNGLTGSGGYPVNLRKVCLLNGNGNSVQTYSDGIEVLNGEGKKTFNIKVFLLQDNFMPSIGQYARIAKTRITIKGPPISLLIITQSYSVTNNNTRGSMDAVQGSVFNATDELYKAFSKELEKEKVRQTWFTVLPNHCFIPSISALAFRNSNFNWNTRVTDRNLLCNNEIYFDGYFIPNTNEEHVTLTSENVKWLTEEIDKGQPNCPPICSFSLVGGTNNLCINSDATYTLDVPVPTGCSVIWDPSSLYQILSSSNNSITIKGLVSGIATISAHIINPCGATSTINKTITIGDAPSAIIGVNTDYVMIHCNVIRYKWTVVGADNATTYYWYYRNNTQGTGFTLLPGSHNNNWIGSPADGSCDEIEVRVEASNACNPSNPQIYIFGSDMCPLYTDPECSYGGRYITVSPNPSITSVHVKLLDDPKAAISDTKLKKIERVRIVDKMGQVKKEIKGNQTDNMIIKISDLPAGIYIILVSDGKTWLSKPIIKE